MWQQLDARLLAGLTKMFSPEGSDVGLRLRQVRDVIIKQGGVMRGRQALFLVYEHYRVDDATMEVSDFANLASLVWTEHDPEVFLRHGMPPLVLSGQAIW